MPNRSSRQRRHRRSGQADQIYQGNPVGLRSEDIGDHGWFGGLDTAPTAPPIAGGAAAKDVPAGPLKDWGQGEDVGPSGWFGDCHGH